MLQRVGGSLEPSPSLTGLPIGEKEVGVPFRKVPFRTVQGRIEFHRGVRDRFGLEIATEIRNRLIRTGAHTAGDQCQGETVKRQRVGLTHWLR
jgi:hypothetical protein